MLSLFKTKIILSHSKEVVTPYFDIFSMNFDKEKEEGLPVFFMKIYNDQSPVSLYEIPEKSAPLFKHDSQGFSGLYGLEQL